MIDNEPKYLIRVKTAYTFDEAIEYMKMKDKQPKKPLYYYYILALGVILLLNTFVFPSLFKPQVKEVPYGTFLQMVDEAKFSKVEITEKRMAAMSRSMTRAGGGSLATSSSAGQSRICQWRGC